MLNRKTLTQELQRLLADPNADPEQMKALASALVWAIAMDDAMKVTAHDE